MSPNQILAKILAEVKTVGIGNCAAVFDLDSTLFCVSPRSQAILRDLAADPRFQSRFPAASRILASARILPTEYGIKQALFRTGLSPSQDLVETVRSYWRQYFFSNSHMHHDLMYPGAHEFVTRVHEGGADVYYLTGRNETLMRDGTMVNLKTWNFPDLPFERVMMKPNDQDSDENFKEQKLKDLSARYKRIWFFENEPVIIHQVRRELPDLRIVFIDSAHSGKANPPTDLLTVRMDFRN